MFSKSIPVTGYKNPAGRVSSTPCTQTNVHWMQHKDKDKDKGDDLLCSCYIFHPEWPNTSSFRNAARPRARGAPRKKAMEHKEVLKPEKTAKWGICTGNCLQNPT